MLNFTVPAGIGDTSWVYSKISELAKTRAIGIRVCDWLPLRTEPLVRLLPEVTYLGYTPWNYPEGSLDINTDLSLLPDGEYRLQVNKALESSMPLRDILPHQATDYHYKLNTTDHHEQAAEGFLSRREGYPRIGINASMYNAACPWNAGLWVAFCTLLRDRYPEAAFYLIGADWDDRTRDVYSSLASLDFNCIQSVGSHELGITIEVIRRLDYLFAYPSGLGILADVVNTPCLMWLYDNFPQGLRDMYADPVNVASGRHLNARQMSVPDSFKYFLDHGAKHIL